MRLFRKRPTPIPTPTPDELERLRLEAAERLDEGIAAAAEAEAYLKNGGKPSDPEFKKALPLMTGATEAAAKYARALEERS